MQKIIGENNIWRMSIMLESEMMSNKTEVEYF